MKSFWPVFFSLPILFIACETQPAYDLVLTNGTIYDGSGSGPYIGAVAIQSDTLAYVGKDVAIGGKTVVDVKGKAIAPGFINMLSWAVESLIQDGKSQSDIRQGVTLEVFGEGMSWGPLNERMKEEMKKQQGDFTYPVAWNSLGEYLEFLEKRGVSCNVASFVGATTLRVHEVGYEDRPPSPEELDTMKQLARKAMEEGAVGIGSSLIYAPAFYAKTDELIELCKVAAEYDGMYISHLRSESNRFLQALDELIRIAKESGIRAEIYHLKAGGAQNHPKMDLAIQKIDSARMTGLEITTDMYNYIAGATGLDAAMPPWVQEGGYEAWRKRLQDPFIRNKVKKEMMTDTDAWENLYFMAGAEGVVLNGFKNEGLRKYTGKTLAEVAGILGSTPEEAAMDLVIQDGSRVGAVYFLMSEENVKKQLKLPYMSFGSDAGSLAPEGSFLNYNPHPRAYGNFARLLGKYVRDEQVIPLEDAIFKLTHLSALKLRIKKRGLLQPGYFADVVVFDPEAIQDHATFEDPHQYATGMIHVFVNGEQVLKDGEHTGATPGRVVRGPGWKGEG
ncbi:MAG: D-aminoacylase [Bacteroidota bacterium]